jgi:hypothetical protein
MLPLTINHKMLSNSIREKKKKMMTEEPEMIGTSPTPDMNAQDIYDVEQAGRNEGTLSSPEKINADLTNIDEMETYNGVGVPPADMARMDRLRKYLDNMSMWAPGEKMMRGYE